MNIRCHGFGAAKGYGQAFIAFDIRKMADNPHWIVYGCFA
jgi:hypothetical protein